MNLLYLSSDQMGAGPDPQLGRMLLRRFLEELATSDLRVDMVGCANAAVFLTTTGSPVLDVLRKLQDRGTRIASCKTCLVHYKLDDKVEIGEMGTMDQFVRLLATADKVIHP